MVTAQVREAPRSSARLIRAILLMAAGAAVHLWLFPAARPAVGPVQFAAQTGGAVGTSGTSTAAAVSSSAVDQLAAATAAAARTVKVIVTPIRPAVFRAPQIAEPPAPARIVKAALTSPDLARPAPAVLTQPDVETSESSAPTVSDEPSAPRFESPDTGELHMARSADREPIVPPASANPPSATPAGLTAPRLERSRTVPDRVSQPEEQPSDERLVSAVLQQYRAAYERLDVSAAQSVWPTVNARALSAAFRQLAGQRVTFESCGVSVSGSGSQATARCHGEAAYMPKVGARRTYVASGEWVFDLAKQDASWRIVNAEAIIK